MECLRSAAALHCRLSARRCFAAAAVRHPPNTAPTFRHVQVVVRCRPLNSQEEQDRRERVVEMDVRSGQVLVSEGTLLEKSSWLAVACMHSTRSCSCCSSNTQHQAPHSLAEPLRSCATPNRMRARPLRCLRLTR
jgi:hypothetical protein